MFEKGVVMLQLSHINKIHIIGAVGSGKTTLARRICDMKHIPHIELDNVVWRRAETGDIRRLEGERDAYLQSLIMKEYWVTEGAHYQQWITPALEQADVIIFIDPPYSTRIYRVIKRWIFQCLKIEKANYKPSFSMLVKMIKWTNSHEAQGRKGIKEILIQYEKKVVIVKSAKRIAIE